MTFANVFEAIATEETSIRFTHVDFVSFVCSSSAIFHGTGTRPFLPYEQR